MKISIASDHAGFLMKEHIKKYLSDGGNELSDFGAYSGESSDYPVFGIKAANAVASGVCEFGVIICGTGIGMSIVANKIKGIRAANCINQNMAKLSREHNNANVLNLGARLIDFHTAESITDVFLNTEFAGGRHEKRVALIHELTGR